MKKTIIFISAVLCLMFSSCGTDIEQTDSESAAVPAASQNKVVYTEKETIDFEGTSNADCCTPQTNAEQAADKNNAPSCCSPDLSEVGDCCGE
ncbi:MAG: hypothetical protein IJ740_10570 [Ruminococcus sp.]|nr:hypothetical protein [Ruminococcus sp.]